MSDNGVQVPQSQGEKLSFRASVEVEVCKLRRIQMICLPTIVLAVIGTMFIWGIGTMSSVLWTVIRVIMFAAVLGEFYCFFKARKLTCPKCHKRVAYLLHDPYYSKVDGALLLPKGLPPDMHQCPYCHADWEHAE